MPTSHQPTPYPPKTTLIGISIFLTNFVLLILHFSSTRPASEDIVVDIRRSIGPHDRVASNNNTNEVTVRYDNHTTLKDKKELQTILHEALDNVTKGRVFVEGNSAQLPNQTAHYLQLAIEYQPQTICEIGFNAGHSAATFLAGSHNSSSKYQGFDIWEHSYNEECLQVLRQHFGNQRVLGVQAGDSNQIVPAFVAQNPNFRCDLIHVDGGHFGDVPFLDLTNMRSLAHNDTLVVMDDIACKYGRAYDGNGCKDPMNAWWSFKQQGLLQELGCHSYGIIRGMCWGKYLRLSE